MRGIRERIPSWRRTLRQVIFESDTRSGRAFDAALITAIVLSVVAVALESVPSVRLAWGPRLRSLEWGFTILFTVELLLRLLSAPHPGRYLRSFFGVVDVIAVLPTYTGVLLPGARYLLTIRVIRLLRVFRLLKLTAYVREAHMIATALRMSRRKIGVFMLAVVLLVVILGSLMYAIEGEVSGFTDIPTSIYWAVVTMTTVGYGDLSPQTPLGRFLSSLIMLVGYSIIAVPTGVFSVELSRASSGGRPRARCRACGSAAHDPDARFCTRCGTPLVEGTPEVNTGGQPRRTNDPGDASRATGDPGADLQS